MQYSLALKELIVSQSRQILKKIDLFKIQDRGEIIRGASIMQEGDGVTSLGW